MNELKAWTHMNNAIKVDSTRISRIYSLWEKNKYFDGEQNLWTNSYLVLKHKRLYTKFKDFLLIITIQILKSILPMVYGIPTEIWQWYDHDYL